MDRRTVRMGLGWALGVAASLAGAQTTDGGIYVPGPNNALNPSEAATGYQLLWNGKDFTGWKSYNVASPGTNFAIVAMAGQENGAKKSLSADSNVIEVVGQGESIWTTDTSFQDFDWLVEWQTTSTEAQNGGLLYRFSEKTSKNNNASAIEYQVCNSLWTSEWNHPNETAGSIYEIKPLQNSRVNLDKTPNWTRAAGKWNQSRIIAYKGRIAHYGNGLKLVEDQIGTPDWNTRYKASKFVNFPYFSTVHPGSFFLQDHGQVHVKYRNIRAKKLTQNPWGPDSPYLNKAAAAAGDTSLIDTLTFATALFPTTSADRAPRFGLAPAPRFESGRGGVTVLLGDAAGYDLRLHDLRGAALPLRPQRAADRLIVPAGSVPRAGILSLWKNGHPVQDMVLGNR